VAQAGDGQGYEDQADATALNGLNPIHQMPGLNTWNRLGTAPEHWRHGFRHRHLQAKPLRRWRMRFLRFRRWLDGVTDLAGGLSMIVYEQVRRHVGTDASYAYGGWLAILSAWCEQKSIAYEGVPVGTIKRYVIGKGNADKAAMIAAMRARGFAPADDNEADALALPLWATDAEGDRA
jgi:hypothetical protein